MMVFRCTQLCFTALLCEFNNQIFSGRTGTSFIVYQSPEHLEKSLLISSEFTLTYPLSSLYFQNLNFNRSFWCKQTLHMEILLKIIHNFYPQSCCSMLCFIFCLLRHDNRTLKTISTECAITFSSFRGANDYYHKANMKRNNKNPVGFSNECPENSLKPIR